MFWELVLPYWNASILFEEHEGVFVEGDIRYRGKSRCVRTFCASRNQIVGNTELVIENRGRLKKLSVSSFDGYTMGSLMVMWR